MPLYLTRFRYTPETWARLIGNPEDRRKAAQSYIESVGGKLHGFWYAFGEHDGYNLWEAPDNGSTGLDAFASLRSEAERERSLRLLPAGPPPSEERDGGAGDRAAGEGEA